MLNFLEGFARFKPKVKLNSFETSYGSNRECRYIIFFALEMKWINREEYNTLFSLSDDIGAMLYKIISGLQKQVDENE
jgi:four helix bundle protein